MMSLATRHPRERMRRALRLMSLGAILVLPAACSDEGPISGPGTMTATLVGPNPSEGAAVVALLGDGIGAVTELGDTEAFSRASSSRVQVVLVNETGGALSFRVAVPDTTEPPAWLVQEVAGPDDELRDGLDEYTVEFAR